MLHAAVNSRFIEISHNCSVHQFFSVLTLPGRASSLENKSRLSANGIQPKLHQLKKAGQLNKKNKSSSSSDISISCCHCISRQTSVIW